MGSYAIAGLACVVTLALLILVYAIKLLWDNRKL